LAGFDNVEVLFAPKAAKVVAEIVWHHTQKAVRRSFEGQVSRLAVPISKEDLAVRRARSIQRILTPGGDPLN